MSFEYDAPQALLQRLKIGREEFLQRLLTCLIVGGPYPRWNTRSTPSPAGVGFLRALHALSFGGAWPGDDCEFVDELELTGRTDDEKGGAPDWAVVWPGRLWIIELKTEAASHRDGQIPLYFELGAHHHPGAVVELTYLTPPMRDYRPPGDTLRYGHLTWAEVAPLVRAHWGAADTPGQGVAVEGILDAIDGLDQPARPWLDAYSARTAPGRPGWDLDAALRLAEQTADDGQQRAVDVRFDGLDEMLEARMELRDALASTPQNSPLRRVVPWSWRWESTGSPLTDAGIETGRELRLSRYDNPQY